MVLLNDRIFIKEYVDNESSVLGVAQTNDADKITPESYEISSTTKVWEKAPKMNRGLKILK